MSKSSEPLIFFERSVYVNRGLHPKAETPVKEWADVHGAELDGFEPWTTGEGIDPETGEKLPSVPMKKPYFFKVTPPTDELLAIFIKKFGKYLVTDYVEESVGLKSDKFDKPDEPHATLENVWWSFPVKHAPRMYFRSPEKHWFTYPPSKLMKDLGFNTEKKKLANLLDFADDRIALWDYLGLMPAEMRTEYGEEWVNIILGPVAATLKLRGQGFDDRFKVINEPGLIMLFEAMGLGLVPPGARKELYAKLVERFNAEFLAKLDTSEWIETYRLPPKWTHYNGVRMEVQPTMYERVVEPSITGEEVARIVFYAILEGVLAPIFDAAGGDELTAMIVKVLEANPKQAGEAKQDPKIVGWIMGQVMRASPTKLDPNTVRAAILEAL